ncbi:DUF6098 family protein [Microbacterium paludicola]|uniref:DUF6098 family protein n=1 Tax=Microbacterium paludicola TaxID=300019 RepID=UPI003879C0CE
MTSSGPSPSRSTDLRTLTSLAELSELVRSREQSYVRYSEGPRHDASEQSRDTEDWLARQVCQYAELAEKNSDRYAWVLDGRTVGRGPDCEPLLTEVEPLAVLAPELLDEAIARYEERFEAGSGPED